MGVAFVGMEQVFGTGDGDGVGLGESVAFSVGVGFGDAFACGKLVEAGDVFGEEEGLYVGVGDF